MKNIYIKLLCGFFMLCANHSCFSQVRNFKDFTNNIFFNFFYGETDSTLCNFINKYVNINYCEKKIEKALVQGWSTNDTTTTLLPSVQIESHSFYFSKHPFVKDSFSLGKIEIQTSEIFKGKIEIDEISVFLFFKEKEKAIKFYNNLSDSFSKISSVKKITQSRYIRKAEFNENKVNNNLSITIKLIPEISGNYNYYIIVNNHNSL